MYSDFLLFDWNSKTEMTEMIDWNWHSIVSSPSNQETISSN